MTTFVTTKEACRQIGVHPNTLRQWDKDGKIRTQRTPGGKRLYDTSSVLKGKGKIVYARVSSRNQKDDLASQAKHLKERFPTHELIADYGSGLNFKRKGFNSLLDRIMSGDVEEVVVAHRDRLCRFGFELVQRVANKNNCRIVVLDESSLSPQEELVRDLISIIHVFSCRIYGLRKYGRKVKEDTDLPKTN
jgi:excisionase family DNA binding protein